MTSQLQTPLDDVPGGGAILAGTVLSDPLRVVDNEGERTLLIETGDAFSVQLEWQLTGFLVPFISGTWSVELFIDDIDGVGTKAGSLGTLLVVAPGATLSPAMFNATFTVPTAAGDAGLYQLAATISFSPTGAPMGQGSAIFGFVESTPIRIQDTVLDTN